MKFYQAIIHVHSSCSFDCLTSPKRIIDKAVSENIDLICITDHDTLKGSILAKKYAEKKYGEKIKVVIGAEYNSTHGDIIGLDIKEEIYLKEPDAIINAIREQQGLVLLPHPYYHHKEVERLAVLSDMIEVFNARISEPLNDLAVNLASRLEKPTYVASDAHFLEDLLLCRNAYKIVGSSVGNYRELLLSNPSDFTTDYSNLINVYKSQMIRVNAKIGVGL